MVFGVGEWEGLSIEQWLLVRLATQVFFLQSSYEIGLRFACCLVEGR